MVMVKNIEEIITAINKNGDMLVSMNNNELVIMDIKEYREKDWRKIEQKDNIEEWL